MLVRICFLLSLLSLSGALRNPHSYSLAGVKIFVNDKLIDVLTNNEYDTYYTLPANSTMHIESRHQFSHVYIMYHQKVSSGEIRTPTSRLRVGGNGCLHELVKLQSPTYHCTLRYISLVSITLVYCFNNRIPTWVQDWNAPHIHPDLLLICAHSDDEQLFFAGLVPSALARGISVQICYLITHPDQAYRLHELLNGLWKVGIRHYPILGIISDSYSKSLHGAIKTLRKDNLSLASVVTYLATLMVSLSPYVVVTHDLRGEYGHGQHRLTSYSVILALRYLRKRREPVPCKVYLHSYPRHSVIMDYDVPLTLFEGRTAYEVAKEAFKEHQSQANTTYPEWLNGPNNSYSSAFQIHPYSPTVFGLYHTSQNRARKCKDLLDIEQCRGADMELNSTHSRNHFVACLLMLTCVSISAYAAYTNHIRKPNIHL